MSRRVSEARGMTLRELPVEADVVQAALTESRDYNERVAFAAGTVRVVSVEDVGPGDDDEATVREGASS